MHFPHIIMTLMMATMSLCSGETEACLFKGCECDDFYPVNIRCVQKNQFPERNLEVEGHNLETLDLSRTELTTIPDGALEDLTIEFVDLTENKLTELGPDVFRGVKRIDQLDLKNNQINFIDEATFQPLSKTKILWLNRNNLDQLGDGLSEVLNRFEMISQLSLPHNKLRKIPDLSTMTTLSDLQLDGNFIESIIGNDPDKLLLPESLITLGLSNNRIKELDPRSFMNLKKLKYLNLESNLIEYISAETFRDLPHLLTLSLSKNFISHIPANMVLHNSELIRLDLSTQNTMLKTIDNYAFDRKLSENNKPLHTLDLSNNRLAKMPDKMFCSRQSASLYLNIEKIDLAANLITNLNPCIVRQLAKGWVQKQNSLNKRPVLHFKDNNHIHTTLQYINCDCNVTKSASLVELQGRCSKNDEFINLDAYRCSLISSSDNIKNDIEEMCGSTPQYNCEISPEEPTKEEKDNEVETEVNIVNKSEEPRYTNFVSKIVTKINNIVNTHTSISVKNDDRNIKMNTKKPSPSRGDDNAGGRLKVSIGCMLTFLISSLMIRYF